jgi:hypothetical protein
MNSWSSCAATPASTSISKWRATPRFILSPTVTFIPSAEDQAPYFGETKLVCTATAGSEGVFSGPKSNIPWSLKWSRAFCNTLAAEGFWGGHTGPWFHREKFGFSFWDSDANNNNSMAVLRAKWTGKLQPSLYKKP